MDAPHGAAACVGSGAYDQSFGGHTYRYVSGPELDYDTAFDACAADGAHLAIIESADEQAFVAPLVAGGPTDAWIGLDDLQVEGSFTWVDHTPLASAAFQPWDDGQPDDGGETHDEDCVFLESDGSGAWNDGHCAVTRPYVCECDPDYVAPTTPACRAAPTGFVTVLGRRYMPGTSEITRDAAETACRGMGAYLFSPADDTENAELHDGGGVGIATDAWIGLAPNAAATAFVWDDGADSPYINWQSSTPTPQAGACPYLQASNSRWSTQSCGNAQGYACECDPESVAP